MPESDSAEKLCIGFLTAIDDQRGFVGGLLVTNRFGRPLEFQCTAPVKPNRTQELLYGPTLVPFVLAELLAKTLVEKVGVKPHLILTDREEILDLRQHVSLPVALVTNVSQDTPEAGGRQLRFHAAHQADEVLVAHTAGAIIERGDLREPLERVREALQETMTVGGTR